MPGKGSEFQGVIPHYLLHQRIYDDLYVVPISGTGYTYFILSNFFLLLLLSSSALRFYVSSYLALIPLSLFFGK
jgi:hypothetical protein